PGVRRRLPGRQGAPPVVGVGDLPGRGAGDPEGDDRGERQLVLVPPARSQRDRGRGAGPPVRLPLGEDQRVQQVRVRVHLGGIELLADDQRGRGARGEGGRGAV